MCSPSLCQEWMRLFRFRRATGGCSVCEARMSRRTLFWSLLVGFLALDLATKYWVRASMVEGQSLAMPWPGIFEIHLTYNRGIAFGLFQGAGILLAPIALAIAAGAIWYNERHHHEGPWGHVSAALLASGALGNLYDRVTLGKVTDMFWFRLIDFPVFNVADACITVAAFMLILTWAKDAVVPADGPIEPTPVPPVETSPAPAE